MKSSILTRAVNALHRRCGGSGAAHPYDGLPFLLVAGVGRSGTTILRQSLGSHPSVDSTGTENNILYDLFETIQHNRTFPSRRATLRLDPWRYDRLFRLLVLNLLWPEPRRGAARPRALLACAGLTPERAACFARLFPNGHIVYIVRNGIEVVSSRTMHEYFGADSFEDHCREWLKPHQMAAWGRDRADMTLVRHEELLDADKRRACYDRIQAHCALPHSDACDAFAARKVYHPTQLAGESAAQAEDLTQRKERWRLWSAEDRATFSRVCGDAMRYFGYAIPWDEDEG